MAREIRNGKSIVRGAVNKIGRQCARHRVAPPVGQLGLQNAGSAGADEHTHALRTIFCAGHAHRLGKAILQQAQQREPVVAAIKFRQVRGQLHRIHPGHLANESRQVHRLKRARRQPATALAQGVQRLVETATDAAGDCEMGEVERVQGEVNLLSVKKPVSKLEVTACGRVTACTRTAPARPTHGRHLTQR